MRMLIDCNDLLSVEEFTDIDLVQGWEKGHDPAKEPPTDLTLGLSNPAREKTDTYYAGEYMMDGTWETYNKAVANYNKIVMDVLEKGFFKMSDFENFVWY